MKRLFLKALYLFVVTAMLCGCEFISSIENGGGEQETPDDLSEIYAYNNIESDKWDYLIAQSKDKMILVDDSGERINAFGVAEDAFVAIDINEVDGMLAIESEGTNIRVNRGELAMVVIYNVLWVSVREIYPYDNIGENETRASASNRSMLEVLTGELCNTILDAIGNMGNVSLGGIETGIKLMKYLYDTKDMNDNEIRDYIIDEGYNLISKDTLDKLFGWADTHEEENYQRPIFFVGIKTGDCIVDKNEAKCSIDGCLYVDGNGGEFDFDYGICCSQGSPDIHDIVMSKNVTSGLLSTIDVGLPAYLSFTSLSEGRYYYVAFVKDNITGNVMYADNICQFDIMYSPERDILIKFYHDTGGDNWTRNDNWCSDKPIGEWYGIAVDNGYYDGNASWVEERRVTLYLGNNNLQGSGSLAGMETLRGLSCYNNQLTSLNCSGCTALEESHCYNNQLITLDVSGCTALEHLCCEDNQLTTLDVSGYTALCGLRCYNNQLTSLDCSGCTALEELYCSINQLTTLDVSGCTALVELYCCTTQLTTLDVSGCTALYWLECCNNNQLTTLDVSGCTALYWLECEDNQLTSLNCSGFTVLEDLICHNNQLTTLDVSGCTALYGLGCSNNQLTSLDVSGCTALHWLNCEKNQLTQEITGIFAQIPDFWHDVRYEYWDEWVDGVRVRRYKDRGMGWWYPGEPQKGYHY